MKKRISIILAVVMLVSITVVAFATGIVSPPTPREDNQVSNWAIDSVLKAGEVNLLEEGRNYVYTRPITREEFCELIYNLIEKSVGVEWEWNNQSPNPFSDTKNEKVIALTLGEIIKGKGEWKFAPNDTLTREEAATIIERTTKKAIPVPMHELYYTFEDENEISDWAMNGVQAVCNMGIMKGTGEGKFSPKGIFTVEEAVTALMRIYDTYKANENIKNGVVITDEMTGGVTVISDEADVKAISDILTGYAYDRPLCKGIVTHTITYKDETYYLLESCGELKKGDKQAKLSEKDLTTILKVIEKTNASFVATPETSLSFADNMNAQMPKDKNYMFSPLSIKMALAMAANGAQRETQREILNAIGVFDLTLYNKSIKTLIDTYSQSELLKLNVANSIWINKDKTDQRFATNYQNHVANIFNATSGIVDNNNATKEINGWVNEKTNGKIPTIISEDNKDFWAMLVNAVYFKGRWQSEFSKGATKEDIFTDRNGKENTIDFMNKRNWMQVSNKNDVIVVELPYLTREDVISEDGEYIETKKLEGVDISMYLMMSDDDFNPELNLNQAQFDSTYVELSVPKFKVEYSADIMPLLQNLGINKAFLPEAEFQNMFDEGNMWIDSAIHKTYINVDEEGTEAAAVTALGMAGSALPPEPIELKYNKPFTFVIKDNANGEILFMGEYAFAK